MRILAPGITSPYTPRSMPARAASFAVLGTLALATGCSGQVVATADADSLSTQALLGVEIMAPAGEPRETRTHASAYFLRMAKTTDEALASDLLGATLELPPVGQCERISLFEGDRGMPLASLGPIDLVDVGAVTIEAGRERAPLAARAFPDVVDLISGVVYTTRDAAEAFPAPSVYRFELTGSAQFAPTTIETAAPPLPDDVLVASQRLGAEPVIAAREDLAIAWSKGSGDDLVYVDLTSYEPSRLARIRCTFADEGRAIIPEAALPQADAAGIAIHRVQRQAIVAEGFDKGEVRFDLAVAGMVRFGVIEAVDDVDGG